VIKGFILCGYARTGSTLLCRALHATGRIGLAQEYFNPVAIEMKRGKPYPTGRHDQLREIARRGTAPNGVYGVKMFADQFDALDGFDWIGALPNPVFVHLERRDALGQAISNVRAVQSGQWNSEQPVRRQVRYDEAAIAAELVRTARYRARWQLFFARNGIAPLWLTYEDLVVDLAAAVRRVAQALEISDLPDPLAMPQTIEPQADSTSDEWRARFITAQRDLTRLDQLIQSRPKFLSRRLVHKWLARR
jgi:LPS sulfotransferase NodH